MTKPLVRLYNVSYLYPGAKTPALKNINLEIHPGEFLGLIGPTGAGKSTLCQTLNGSVPQFYGGRFFGQVIVAGLDTVEHPISELARHGGLVFEDPEMQLVAPSVENEIALGLENLSVPRAEIRARITQVLAAVRLSGAEKRHPQELSGGQKQRLAIAAALAMRPALLVLDEPTSQLDPLGAAEVFATLRQLNRELGITILLTGHDAEELAAHTDRIALLAGGELVAQGPPQEIYSRVELLAAHHLRPPQVTHTFQLVRQRGVVIPQLPTRLAAGKRLLHALPTSCPTAKNESVAAPDHLGPALLAIKNLTQRYANGTPALHNISLKIRAGEYVLLVGQNGAGKSTLVKHFLNLLTPTAGTVTVDGLDTRQLETSELAQRIGYVGQNPDDQLFTASVEDEVAFALQNLGYAEAEIKRRVTVGLRQLGLAAQRTAHPLSLPRGDRARLVIAAVLAMEPEIIILDEPTTGQDYRGVKYILELSRELHQRGKTIIVITHHLYLMPEYAERVIVLGKGTILLDAPLRRAYHAKELLRRTYLTPPQAVLLAQELAPPAGGSAPLRVTPEEVAACFLPGGGR